MKRVFYKTWLITRSLIAYALTGIAGLILFVPCLILAGVLPESWRYRSTVLFTLLHWTYWVSIRTLLVSVRVKGAENIPQPPVIFVANHESSLDIPFLGSVIPARPHLWYAYHVFFSTPVLGFFLRKMAIPVYSENPTRAARAMVRSLCLTRTYQLDALLFPEGGRFVDGKVHDFFAGFAMLAKKLGLPVVPVMIRNAGKVYPPGSFLLYPHTVEIEIGTPFIYTDQETQAEFTARVHRWYIDRT